MKVTGYKIKEAIKGFEHILSDVELDPTEVPSGHDKSGKENLIRKLEKLNDSFLKIQILKNKILSLKKIQQKYNSLVKVDTDLTLADAIQNASYPAQLISHLTKLINEVVASSYNVSRNRQLSDKTLEFPNGKRPIYDEPVIEKEVLQSLVRRLKTNETKIKNLIGFGNGVEIELDVDVSLLDEDSWNNFDFAKEVLNYASAIDLYDGKVVFENGLVLDKETLDHFSKNIESNESVIGKTEVSVTYDDVFPSFVK